MPIILSVLVAACNGEVKQAEEEVVLDTLTQKISYVVGYSTAQQINDEGYQLDSAIISAAIDDLNQGRTPRMTEEEMHAAMSAFQTEVQEKRQASFNSQAEENAKRGKEFFAKNTQREGVVTTDSGMQYEVLVSGGGASPSPTDNVSVNYKGSLLTGEIFDQGEAVTFRVDQLIPGWVEALSLMKVGAKWKLYLPPELAYGPGGVGDIGPNSSLIFEMELLDIVEGGTEEMHMPEDEFHQPH